MSDQQIRAILIVAVVAACTLATRALPFLIFTAQRQPSAKIRYLGARLPFAVMAILVVYSLKGVSFAALSGWVPSASAVAAVSATYLWKRNNLLSIAAGTAVYMAMVQVVFA